MHSVEVGFLCRNDLLELAIAKVNYNMRFCLSQQKSLSLLVLHYAGVQGKGVFLNTNAPLQGVEGSLVGTADAQLFCGRLGCT